MLRSVVGIDEVGRGCWAGPLVAAAVVLKEPIAGLTDSKLLSKKQRQNLAFQIEATAIFGIGWVWPEEIDQLGLTIATANAMKEALDQIPPMYDEIIIDGHFDYLNLQGRTSHISHVKTLVKADLTVPAVSAASILAKVARDNYMKEQAIQYPVYGFDRHVGYGTATHIAALKSFGTCALHRLSYKPVKALLA